MVLSEDKVKQVYSTCFDQALLWLERTGYGIYPKGIRIKTSKEANETVRVWTSHTMHLRDWPYRSGGSNKLDILLSIRDTISLKNGACIEASVNISYFHIKGPTAIAVESLHYDCNVPPQAQHPICHAQNTHRTVTPLPESFTWKVKGGAIQNRCQNVRVPTAFINLPGILCILAADHMAPEHWVQFMDHCQTHFEHIPGLLKHSIVDSAIPKHRLSAWAWYQR